MAHKRICLATIADLTLPPNRFLNGNISFPAPFYLHHQGHQPILYYAISPFPSR